jgi:hypothetical protein
MEPQGVDTCLYGSVIGLQSLKQQDQSESSVSLNHSRTSSPIAEEAQSAIKRLNSSSNPTAICDECEHLQASSYCQDCDLFYCSKCNLHRHRKGKLVQHRRQEIMATNDVLSSSNESIASSSTTTSSFGLLRAPTNIPAASWNQENVQKWLIEHELDCFTKEFQEHSINGAFLTSLRMDEFLDTISSAPRAYKKKLSREIQKLKSNGLEEESKTARRVSSSLRVASVSPPAPPSFPPTFVSNPARRNTFNLRVNVNTQASPVASLRSRYVNVYLSLYFT